jgi:hypothetical protein
MSSYGDKLRETSQSLTPEFAIRRCTQGRILYCTYGSFYGGVSGPGYVALNGRTAVSNELEGICKDAFVA